VPDWRFGVYAMSDRLRARLLVALAGSWVIGVTVITLPAPIPAPGLDHLDTSWELGLVMAARDGLHFGSDVVWTYGPLGRFEMLALWFRREWIESLVVVVAIDLALISATALLLRVRHASIAAWIVVTSAMLTFTVVFPDVASVTDTPSVELQLVFIGIVLLLLMFAVRSPRSVLSSALCAGAALGAATLVKQTDVVVVVSIMVIAAAIGWRTPELRRGVAAAAGAGVISALVLWFATGQGVGDFLPYVRGAIAIATDYRPALSGFGLGGVDWALGSIALVMCILAWACWRRAFGIARACALVMPFLVEMVQEGFVRDDPGHAFFFWSVLVFASAVIAIEAFAGLSLRHLQLRQLALPAGVCALTLLTASGLVVATNGQPAPESLLTRLSGWPHAIAVATSARVAAQDEAMLRAALVSDYGLSPIDRRMIGNESVDVLPWDIDLIWAYRLNWDQRPVLESYSAYDAYLDSIDSAHFIGPSRPAYVLYQLTSIDDRYPAFDEPLTLQALLRAYTVQQAAGVATGSQGDFLLLRSSALPPPIHPQPQGTACVTLGVVLPVPQVTGRVVFADVALGYSLRGDVLKALLKPSYPTVQFTLANGDKSGVFRWVQAQGGSGLLANAYVANDAQMAALFGGDISSPVTGMTFNSPAPEDYAPRVCADFWSLPLPPR